MNEVMKPISLPVVKGHSVWYFTVLYKSWFRIWNRLSNTCAFGKATASDLHKSEVNNKSKGTKEQKHLIATEQHSSLFSKEIPVNSLSSYLHG
jgi:hypothetical protein